MSHRRAHFAICLLSACSFVAAQVPTNGLVEYYKFNEGTGVTVNDSSGSGITGTLTADGCTWVSGVQGGAVDFDGTTGGMDCVNDNAITPTTSATLCAWVKPDALVGGDAGYMSIVQKGAGFRLMFVQGLYGDEGVVVHGIRPGYGFMTGKPLPNNFVVGRWYHVAFTFDGPTKACCIYINGASEPIVPAGSGYPDTMIADTNRLTVGYQNAPWTPSNHFPGAIDEVRIYNRALSATEIRAICAANGPSFTMTSPNTRVAWVVNSTQSITWTSIDPRSDIGRVKLDYTINDGWTWLPVVAGTPNNGAYPWTVPNTPSTSCRVRVNDSATGGPVDESDVDFIITLPQALTLTSPHGGEVWPADTVHAITWTTQGILDAVTIEYSINSGSNWAAIVTGAANSGSYAWVPPNLPSTTCLVRIMDAAGGGAADTSDSAFTIAPPGTQTVTPSITITSPNGGETWPADSIRSITWTSQGTVGNVTIQYAVNGGATWATIFANTANNGAYVWRVPEVGSSACRVRIFGTADGTPADTSDSSFTIVGGPARVTAARRVPTTTGLTSVSVGPAAGSIVVQYALASAADAALTVYDARGALVKRLVQGVQPAGYYYVVWNGRDDSGTHVARGVYVLVSRMGTQMSRRVLTIAR